MRKIYIIGGLLLTGIGASFFVLHWPSYPSKSTQEEDIKQSNSGSSQSVTPDNKERVEGITTSSPETSKKPSDQLVEHLYNIQGIPSAKAVAFTPDGKELWAVSLLNKQSGLSVFAVDSGKKIQDIPLGEGGGVELVFSSDGSKVYVSQMETASVFEIDAHTKKILRTFKTKGNWTKVLALSHDGKTLFASNWVSNNISEIDIETGKTLRLIPTVKTPRGLYPTQDGMYLYVTGFDGGEIQKINLKTLEKKIIFQTGGAMRHLVADEQKGVLYASDMAKNTIYAVNLRDDSVGVFTTTDNNPNTIALSSDKKILIVSCRGKNATADNYYIPGPEWGSVLIFNTNSGKLLDALVGGNQPTALDISKDMTHFAFSDFLDARIQMFELPSYASLLEGNGGKSSTYKSQLKK